MSAGRVMPRPSGPDVEGIPGSIGAHAGRPAAVQRRWRAGCRGPRVPRTRRTPRPIRRRTPWAAIAPRPVPAVPAAETGPSGRGRLGSNHDATVCRSVGPPARSNRPRLSLPPTPPASLVDRGGHAEPPARSGRGAGRLRRLVRLLRRLEPRVQVALQERLAQRRQQVAVDPVRVAEPDLDLGRVHVDVDLLGRDVQVEERHRHPPDHQQAAIRLVQRVAQRAVADVPSPEEEELPLGRSTGSATGCAT